jgi:hypothetical protein
MTNQGVLEMLITLLERPGELCKARIDSGFGSTYLLSRPTYGPHLCIASRAAGWAGRELVHRQYSRTRLQLRRLSQGFSTRELNEKRPSRPNVCKKYHTAGSCCPRSTTAAQRPVRSPSGLAVRLDRSLPSAVRPARRRFCSCCSRAAGGRHGHRPSGDVKQETDSAKGIPHARSRAAATIQGDAHGPWIASPFARGAGKVWSVELKPEVDGADRWWRTR